MNPDKEMHKTERGFTRADFYDIYKQECSIQASSLATIPALWLGVDKGLDPNPMPGRPRTLVETQGRMHIDQYLAAWLWPKLKHFAETGRLE